MTANLIHFGSVLPEANMRMRTSSRFLLHQIANSAHKMPHGLLNAHARARESPEMAKNYTQENMAKSKKPAAKKKKNLPLSQRIQQNK